MVTLFLVLVPVVILVTVITQEIHIPGVSTQKLIILCPRPDPVAAQPNFWARMETMLDTSKLAQNVLGYLEIPVVVPAPVLSGLLRHHSDD